MPISNSQVFGPFADALRVHRQRLEVLAGNVANADTPGYQARDIDFRSVLSRTQGGVEGPIAPRVTSAGHIGGLSAGRAPLIRSVPLQPSADGNSVDMQTEKARFAEASVRYEATLRFIDGRVRSMLTALTGE